VEEGSGDSRRRAAYAAGSSNGYGYGFSALPAY
jgi:hypothetical protein